MQRIGFVRRVVLVVAVKEAPFVVPVLTSVVLSVKALRLGQLVFFVLVDGKPSCPQIRETDQVRIRRCRVRGGRNRIVWLTSNRRDRGVLSSTSSLILLVGGRSSLRFVQSLRGGISFFLRDEDLVPCRRPNTTMFSEFLAGHRLVAPLLLLLQGAIPFNLLKRDLLFSNERRVELGQHVVDRIERSNVEFRLLRLSDLNGRWGWRVSTAWHIVCRRDLSKNARRRGGR